jgi:PTS system N-acetylglucosamine-specific IIC component
LRLRIVNQDLVDEVTLKSLGAAGILRPTPDTVQVVMGLRADEIAGNIRAAVSVIKAVTPVDAGATSGVKTGQEEGISVAPQLLEALGGIKNILGVDAFNTRLSLQLRDTSLADEESIHDAGFRGLAILGDGKVQVLADGGVSQLADKINEELIGESKVDSGSSPE